MNGQVSLERNTGPQVLSLLMALRILRCLGRRRPDASRSCPPYDPFTASLAWSAIDATFSSTFEASCLADVDMACARPPALWK